MGMLLSASQAAKETGKAIPTITRAIKKGKISAHKTEEGGYKIDPAELFRVFPKVDNKVTDETPPKLGHATDTKPPEVMVLEARLEGLEQLLKERAETINDLRGRLDEADQERRTMLTQIADMRDRETPRGFLGLFKRTA